MSEKKITKNLKQVPRSLREIKFENTSNPTLKSPDALFNNKLKSPEELFKKNNSKQS